MIFLCFSGCAGGAVRQSSKPEVDDKNFALAMRHIRSGAYDNAIKALMAVVKSRDTAPESNLLLGTLHMDKRDDPVTAMYFLRRYIEECDDRNQIKIAEQLIDTAKKKFLKSLPAYNGVSQSESELLEAARALKAQNTSLRNQAASYRKKLSDCEAKLAALTDASNGEMRSMGNAGEGPMVHTVRGGETLSSISAKYYGTPHFWEKILRVNASTIEDPKSLRPGQKLIIP
ncbi:MAG: LysM peptidoglycan-binding domain-containing protein [Puniceicoccales bacterium]|nr:LysM peptidoglycan-binding domain-containing protein [Puniceicoccales bacterium]